MYTGKKSRRCVVGKGRGAAGLHLSTPSFPNLYNLLQVSISQRTNPQGLSHNHTRFISVGTKNAQSCHSHARLTLLASELDGGKDMLPDILFLSEAWKQQQTSWCDNAEDVGSRGWKAWWSSAQEGTQNNGTGVGIVIQPKRLSSMSKISVIKPCH